MIERRTATVVAVAALAAVLVAAPASAAPVLRVDGDRARTVQDPSLPEASGLPPASGLAAKRAEAAATRRPPGAGVERRRPSAGAARRPTVKGALRRALRRRMISPRQHRRYRAAYYRARVTLRRLPGPHRRRELAGALANLSGIAARGRLTPSRMPVLFMALARNTVFWRWHGPPAHLGHVKFRRSPLVFQYLRGEGLLFNPLATAGRANYYVRVCGRRKPGKRKGTRCMLGRRLLNELRFLAARRSGFSAWEYYVHYGGGQPPWVSGIGQATAIQALSRGSRVYRTPSYLATAREATGAFARRPPDGNRVPIGGGAHYLIYSFDRRLFVLNSFVQILNGLHDYMTISRDARGRRLFAAGDRRLRREIGLYDTGRWTRYSIGGYEASVGYHRFARDGLASLCRRTGKPAYCAGARRFTSYLRQRGLAASAVGRL